MLIKTTLKHIYYNISSCISCTYQFTLSLDIKMKTTSNNKIFLKTYGQTDRK